MTSVKVLLLLSLSWATGCSGDALLGSYQAGVDGATGGQTSSTGGTSPKDPKDPKDPKGGDPDFEPGFGSHSGGGSWGDDPEGGSHSHDEFQPGGAPPSGGFPPKDGPPPGEPEP